jgi:hypothetical protein
MLPTVSGGIAWGGVNQCVHKYGDDMWERLVEAASTSPLPEESGPPSKEPPHPQQDCAAIPTNPTLSAVVIREIGNTGTTEGKRVVTEFGKLAGIRLPLTPVPSLTTARRMLLDEFPYAREVIDALLFDLVTASHVRFRPTILVGTPGCGKTTFAEALFDVLDVLHETYSCGGVSDPALAGTPRRWSTGEPSLPVALVKRWLTASPGIVLDEVEKVATSRYNGNLLDALLGLLEPRSSSAWHDPYIEAPVDLSNVLWLATANSLDGIPGPLRDRCRILAFPEPGAEHLETIAAALTRKAATVNGLDARWTPPLVPEEFDALRQFWKGGSVRRLARLVEGVLAARGRESGVH